MRFATHRSEGLLAVLPPPVERAQIKFPRKMRFFSHMCQVSNSRSFLPDGSTPSGGKDDGNASEPHLASENTAAPIYGN